jgi:hypothetical protein
MNHTTNLPNDLRNYLKGEGIEEYTLSKLESIRAPGGLSYI